MKAIILAAGMGKRLMQVSDGKPKSMIMINNKSIIQRQLESCRAVGIEDFVFVLGYKKTELQKHILKFIPPENALFVENPIYDKTNTLYSLYLTRDHFDDDFIYFNADVLFKSELLEKIIGESKHSQLLLETKSCKEEEVKMIVDSEMRIWHISKTLPVNQCAGEFIGIGKFKKEILTKFAAFLKYGVDQGQANNYFEYAVDLLAKEAILEAVPTGGIPCIEIDFPEDLIRAREMFEN
jgi:choline kinase